MLPSLTSLSVLKLEDATSAPLSDSATVALRSDPDHARAMAILAYTNHWDGFVNKHVRGITDYLRPFNPPNQATKYAGVVAFFAPMEALQKLAPRGELASSASIGLVKKEPDRSWKVAACKLELLVVRQSSSFAELLAREVVLQILLPAGNGDAEALRTWNAVVAAIARHLDLATGTLPAPLAGEPVATVLYRGMRMDPSTDRNLLFTQMSSVFVSTSSERSIAEQFSEDERRSSSGKERWVLTLTVEPDAPVIVVEKVLPYPWICQRDEKETIIAPGAQYSLISEWYDARNRIRRIEVLVRKQAPDGRFESYTGDQERRVQPRIAAAPP